MTVLARWNGNWYLAGRAGQWSDSHQFSMKVGIRMPGSHGFRRVNNYLARTFESTDGITFYPEIRYRGFRVYPQAWHYESSEPLLHCYMDHSDISAGGWDATKERMRQLIEDGWQWDQRDGGNKYVHVDELEKIEGPPPEGAF